MKTLFLFILPLLSLTGSPISLGTFSVDSQSSYTRIGLLDRPAPPLFINLETLSTPVTPGDVLNITTIGDYCVIETYPCVEYAEPLGGVISSLGPVSLLGAGVTARLPGALSVPGSPGVVTVPTWFDQRPTDIPQDFLLFLGQGTTVTVPAGASWLVVGVLDSYYLDNSDPNHDLGVSLSLVKDADPVVPEPSYSLIVGGIALLMVILASWRRGGVRLARLAGRRYALASQGICRVAPGTCRLCGYSCCNCHMCVRVRHHWANLCVLCFGAGRSIEMARLAVRDWRQQR